VGHLRVALEQQPVVVEVGVRDRREVENEIDPFVDHPGGRLGVGEVGLPELDAVGHPVPFPFREVVDDDHVGVGRESRGQV